MEETYARLAAPFDRTFSDTRGGATFDYITGEQCISRLNEVLGAGGWSFRILEHGIHPEADECWVLGELTATIDGTVVIKQQFGSQKLKRSRSSGTPLDLGFDLKGAATDCLKKTASLIGCALYLWHKEGGVPHDEGAPGNADLSSGARPTRSSAAGAPSLDLDAPTCEECGEPLTETRFKDQTVWSPSQLAVYGRRKHSRILCMTHYRESNQAKRRAEEALQTVAF